MVGKKSTTKPRRQVKPKGKRRPYKKVARRRRDGVPEYASLSCKRTITAPGGANFQVNTLYNYMNAQLADYPCAVQVAQAYQHYRIKRVGLTFKPTFDTYMNNGAQTMSKMHLYWMLDKSGAIPTNVTLEGLKNMGARPFALDEKNRTISWKPSVLESAMYVPGAPLAGSQSAKYSLSPWLSTNNTPINPGVFVPSGIDHLGIYWYCEQLLTPGNTVYEVEVEVQFEFKKPLADIFTSVATAVPAQVAVLNDSKDGIVGGADGV